MPAPTYRSVRLERRLCSACVDPVELMVDHQGLIATIGIEFIGKKDPGRTVPIELSHRGVQK